MCSVDFYYDCWFFFLFGSCEDVDVGEFSDFILLFELMNVCIENF